VDGKTKLAFTGITTFCRTPHVSDMDQVRADVAVLGIPYDEGVGYRPGARFGPRSIRDYSMRFPYFDPTGGQKGYWDIEKRRWFLTETTMVDCGDVDVVPLDMVYVHQQIEANIRGILRSGALPVSLGGDHSVTYPVVRAFDQHSPLSLVQFDAHLDRRDAVGGVKYGHGSPIKRISELNFIEQIVTIGLRGLRAPEEDYLEAERRGEILIPAQTVREIGTGEVLKRIPSLGKCYVTIDIDALDPALAPGTGTPEVDGLKFHQLKEILSGLAATNKIVGLDLVEVNPYLDSSGRTSLLAAQLIVEFLGAIFE
jgi:agmatinase